MASHRLFIRPSRRKPLPPEDQTVYVRYISATREIVIASGESDFSARNVATLAKKRSASVAQANPIRRPAALGFGVYVCERTVTARALTRVLCSDDEQ
jgi:hypothetical protein